MEKTETKKETTKERKNFVLAAKGKTERFEVEVINKKSKNFTATVLGVHLTPHYVKEIRLENDQKGLVLTNGSYMKYEGVLCEGVSSENGLAYIGVDVQVDDLYRIRDFFSWPEKLMLAKAGFLAETK